MELLYILLLAVIIILIHSTKKTLVKKLEQLEHRLNNLQQFPDQGGEAGLPPAADGVTWTVDVTETPPAPVRFPPDAKEQRHAPAPGLPPLKTLKDLTPDWKVVPPAAAEQPVAATAAAQGTSPNDNPLENTRPEPQVAFTPEPRPSFFERHPDLEKFIGENLINKIGIAILVLAIGYFVKFAIDSNWIGPAGRVGIGVLCGGILIGIAHWLRNSYKAFSSVLVGGGIAVLYFTFTLAFHQFHLFSQATTFMILIIITCFAVALSLLYDRQELAVIALIGGLCSPLMLSTGQANYTALLSYLVLLNSGLLVIAYRKSWRILNLSAFGLTVILLAFIISFIPVTAGMTALIYVSVLYLLFFGINVAYNVRENKGFIASDFSILLINTALYFGAGMYLLHLTGYRAFDGLFAVILGLINLLLSYLLFRNKKVDTNILYLLIGITLTFISLAGPIQLHGHFITLFWAAEAVLLYWLYQKSGIPLLKLVSQLVWAGMLFSLLMDWMTIYGQAVNIGPVLANRGFMTTLSTAVATSLLFRLYQQGKKETAAAANYILLLQYAALALFFMSGLLEVSGQFKSYLPGTFLNSIYSIGYMLAFIAIFLSMARRFPAIAPAALLRVILITAGLSIYLLLMKDYFAAQALMLESRQPPAAYFIGHWAGALLAGYLFYQLIISFRSALLPASWKPATWLTAAAIVLFLSLEVCLVINQLFYTPSHTLVYLQTIYIKTVLPVLWGLISFLMMWLGLRYKYLQLRICALSLFALTLAKLFLYDIRNIPPAGKIAAFFFLGLLLLIISFMYQKVKKIIVADEPVQKDDTVQNN